MFAGRLELDIPETLHQAHLLIQLGKNFVSGQNKAAERAARGHDQQLLQRTKADGSSAHVTTFLRLEFQDGKRKDPSQDYHGSGRCHCHQLDYISRQDRTSELQALHLHKSVAATMQCDTAAMSGYVRASQLDWKGQTPCAVHTGDSEFDQTQGIYRIHHSADDHRAGVRAYFAPLMEATKCHQDVQIDGPGEENYAAYTAAYAPKFSDSFSSELLNDDVDANSIAASVLTRYKPCVPEMVLQLFGSILRQWQVSTYSSGKTTFQVPVPDTRTLPVQVRHYERSTWRSDSMTLLEFLRKTNKAGEIAGWVKAAWKKQEQEHGDRRTLVEFANDVPMDGEKIIGCAMVSRLNDKFFGQWLVLNVPFRTITELVPAVVIERVPSTDKYLGMCLACQAPAAQTMWRNSVLIEEDMKLEGHKAAYRREVLRHFEVQANLVQQYLDGNLRAPATPTSSVRSRASKRHQLPIQARFETMIQNGEKTVEGRLNKGKAAEIMEGETILFGHTERIVLRISIHESFRKMLRHVGFENACPHCADVDEAVEVYHSFRNYEEDAARFGVLAFHLGAMPSQEQTSARPAWNTEQRRWLRLMNEDLDRALAVWHSSSEIQQDGARRVAFENNKIRALEGPPGTGKTSVAKAFVDHALEKGCNVLWTVYTAQLASRTREVFGTRIDVDTCHAALGLDRDMAECGLNLAPYTAVILDEFSQLQGKHLGHINNLRGNVDRAQAFGLLGDPCQYAGFGEERIWHVREWGLAVHVTKLHELYRCKDPHFRKILAHLRTARPGVHGGPGTLTVADIMRKRRAWNGHVPTVADVKRLLTTHPTTTFLTVTRQGSCTINALAAQGLFGRQVPLATIPGDIESNWRNYTADGKLKPFDVLEPLNLVIYEGMKIFFTRNVDKTRDYVNGMQATVESFDHATKAVYAVTATGHRVAVHRWTDRDLGNCNYFPVKGGYSSTILKIAGAELPHVVLWLDAIAPGAAYTGMSRVAFGRDLLIGGNLTEDHFAPAR